MKKSKRLIALAILASLFFVGNLWAADGATITAFNPPAGQLTRGQQTTASVTIRNTGDTTRSFWVGLSFAHETATGNSWPEGWYDIYPVQTGELAPNNQETVTFTFPIYDALRPGQYYAVTSVWDSFDQENYLMVNRFDNSIWHTENSAWVTNPELGAVSFSLATYSTLPKDLPTQLSDVIELIAKEPASVLYEQGKKYLLVLPVAGVASSINGIPVSADGSIMFDLADICGATPESSGKNEDNRWVTCWIAGSLGGITLTNEHLNIPDFVPFGIIQHEFDVHEKGVADHRPSTLQFGKLSCPFFTFTGLTWDIGNWDVKGPIFIPGGSNGFEITIEKGNLEGPSFEIKKEILLDIFITALTINNVNNEYIKTAVYSKMVWDLLHNLPSGVFRNTTLDDGDIPLIAGMWQAGLKMDKRYGYEYNANYFVIDVIENTEQLKIIAQNGTGDGSIHTRLGQRPDFLYHEGEYTYGSTIPGSITIANPPAGQYYISMPTTTSYRDMDVVATTTSLHKITASSGFHGSIDPEGDVYVVEGGSKSFNGTPNSGYKVDQWEKNDSVVQNGGSNYTVSNVQGYTKIHVTFKQQAGVDSKTKTLYPTDDIIVKNQSGVKTSSDSSSIVITQNSGDDWWYGLIKFDLTQIPQGSTINSATFKLNSYLVDSGFSYATINPCGISWSENTINWQDHPNYVAGGFSLWCYNNSQLWWEWTDSSGSTAFRDSVQDWLNNPNQNYGFYILPDNSGYEALFRSKEHYDSSLCPKLIVTYTPPLPPDLIITDLYPEPSPVNDTFYVGQSVDWSVTVKNNGTGPADSSSVGYYIGTSSTDLSNRIKSDSTSVLNSGESETDHDAYVFTASDVGQKFLICKADDNEGVEESSEDNNTRVYGPFNVALLNIPPTLTITSPSSNQTVANSTTTYVFSGTASDSDDTVAKVEYRVCSGLWQTASGTTNWSFTIDLEVGDNLVDVCAQDNEGAYSEISSRVINRLPGATNNILSIPFVKSPGVTVDGQVVASEWTGAWSSTSSFIHDGGGQPINGDLRLMYDDTFLYVAIETPLNAGWDSKACIRIDGDNSGSLNGSMTVPYRDIHSEKGSPGSWSGYTNYKALVSSTQVPDVSPGAGQAQASYGNSNVSYEFKIPLSDLGWAKGLLVRLLVTISPDDTNMWYWPVYDSGRANPAVWTELSMQSVTLADAILALQVIVGMETGQTIYDLADVNGDGKIGIEEVIYILQKISGVRD